jgi:hypothetical protein
VAIDAYLILGCNGHTDNDGFVHCNCVSNIILDISESSDKVEKFLDNACGLFDGPIFDYNKCTNAVSMLYKDYGEIKPAMLFKIQSFFRLHKTCGIYLVLILKEDYHAG